MRNVRIKGAAWDDVGASQGYHPISVRYSKFDCAVNGPDTPQVETLWKPTDEELAYLFAGAAIRLSVVGRTQPPILLEVVQGEENDP